MNKNFITFTPELRAKILEQVNEVLTVIESTPETQAQAFAIAQSHITDPDAETAGLCVVAFGPLAVLLMAQINAMPNLYDQMRVMHSRHAKHQQSVNMEKPLVV